MEEKKLITIDDYLKEKGINLEKFSRIVDVSRSYLNPYRYKTNPPFSVKVVKKIYEGTLKEFGVGLIPWEYIDWPTFNNK